MQKNPRHGPRRAAWPETPTVIIYGRWYKRVRRRANAESVFSNQGAAARLIGAVLLEINDDWVIQSRYMQIEGTPARRHGRHGALVNLHLDLGRRHKSLSLGAGSVRTCLHGGCARNVMLERIRDC